MNRQIWTGKPIARIRSRRWTHRKFHIVCWLVFIQYFTCNLTQVEAGLSFTILEEQPPGTVVGKIQDCIGHSCSFDGNSAPFTIDSGLIKSTVKIDRDVLLVNPIALNVRSSDPNIKPPKVQILVGDINDNVPKFPSLYYTLQIAETTTVGGVYPINTATDSDFGNNGTIDYSIVAGNGDKKFTLGIGSNVCQQAAELCIITNNTLDRETTAFYQLKVEARDQGMPSLTGHCLVNISILDSNDNAPLFTSVQYSGAIAENTKPGQNIITVSATDKDIGVNSEIEYSIERDADNSDQTFHVDSNTGVIRTKGSLDYERKRSYRFAIIASDRGQPKESTTATVTVNVIDENDNYPYFAMMIYYPISNTKAVVSEDCQIPTILVFVRVSDNDGSKPNNDVKLEISQGNELGYFIVQPYANLDGAYTIQVSQNLDREKSAHFNLTLNATDQGTPSKSTLAFAVIEVLDVNDNAPKFSKTFYTASVNELAPNGSYVFKMNASDPDAGSNGTISYSITSGNNYGWFQIDSQSGLVTTVMTMDRELFSTVSLTITAQDHGSSPKSGKTILRILILDANDNHPKFSKSVYQESIPEDAKQDRIIVQLNATDLDIGKNAQITYTIDSTSQEILNHFVLDSSSGVLKLKAKVDREIKSSYTIPVIASDNGNPKLSSKASVVVTVTDINDNNPIFYPEVYFVSVIENGQPGFIVKVTATDKDEGLNGRISYSIKNGNSKNSFDIKSDTGAIRTIKSLDHEVNGFHKLEITARDGGGNVAVKSAFVEITVLNQADNPPFFEHSIYNFSLYENVPKGTLVGKVLAKTKEKNDTIVYEIISGDPSHLFVVDSSGGIIMVNGVIDRELRSNFWLDIVAKTGKIKPLSAKASVDITVLDKNDNAPKFSTAIVKVNILGSWPAGKLISDVAAIDNDAGSNGIIRYQLTKHANGLFKINTTSGEVTLARKVTENDNPQYTVPVMASDMGSPPLHSTLTIQANILINHPPKFTSNSYVTHVLASRPLSYRFLIVNAVDGDSGKNGELRYSIDQLGNQEGLFGIFPDGMLYVKKNLIHASKGSYDIIVRATDGGNPSLSATTSVTIYIQDSDEHRTLFSNNTFRFSIAENLTPGSPVGTVTASATDKSKTKDIIYSLVGSNNIFAIDAKSGLITTRLSLDRESLVKESGGSNYIMRVEAVYNDTTVRRDSSIVIITVTDVNDNPPTFSSALYSIKVNENLVPVAVVFKVTAVDPDSSENANFTFSIIKGTGKDMFHIDKSSGDLYLDKPLDRETQDSYSITLQATDILNSSLFSQSMIQISVEDYNDERPVLQSFPSILRVPESLSLGSEIIDLNATDKDIGRNGQIIYSITCGNLETVFDINHSTGKVFLAKELDYEVKTEYHLCFMVKDNGIAPLSSAANLTIKIIDVNDNPPVFDAAPQHFQILENVTIGTEIGRCSATDKDAGTYGQIVFSLDKQTPKGNTFSVDPVTCAIITRAEVNREGMPDGKAYFQLVIKATDKATPSSAALSATKAIVIQVQDVNDNKPRFISPPAAHVGSSTFIMNIKAEDLDAGKNGMVTYNFVTSGPSSNLFYLNSNTGKLDRLSQLNDNKLFYTRIIKAQDAGIPSLADKTEITLFKTGGSGPVFTNSTFRGIITENQLSGVTVLRVSAYYLSSQTNSKIKYYMTADDSKGALKVNEVTGDVITTQKIDRESLGAVLKLVVYAVDMQGPNPRTSSTDVVIKVVDVNDNTPEFSNDRYAVDIDENAPSGSSVITLTATDSDEGDNAKITYSIVGGQHRNLFKIDSQTGLIFTQGELDHESLSLYTINVTARDHGNPSFSSTCLIKVRINDVNDNSPVFSKGFYSFRIFEDTLIGTTVGIVTASDVDSGDNARITYSISGADKDVFRLNPSSGVLTINQRLDRETVQLYLLNVVATDHGKPARFTSVQVYVTVSDINDNSPEFKQNSYYGDILEGASAYTPVVIVQASDRDSGSNGVIKYSILSGNSDFSFGILDNGTIVNLKVLDREFQDGYILTVQATDQATPLSARRHSTTRVTINVTDVNDNKPYFTSASVAHVSESARVGDAVLTVIAVDLDQGSNSQLSYTLTKVDLGAPFTLGPTDGVLRLSGGLDRESQENYTIKVTATDKGIPTLSSDMKIVIVVDDFNDHAPVFLQHPKNVLIFENVSIGSDVLKFSATDQDSGSNAEVRYEIVTGNDNGAFTINSITGRLRTAKPLDRETNPKQMLEIRAHDLGVPRKSSVTTVTVMLRDVNDNKPVFTKDTYKVNVLEGVVVSEVVRVVAKDNDEGSDGDVTYRISSGDVSGLFVINSKTGAVGLTATLDREHKDRYELTIEAKDGGSPRLSGTCHVIIQVLDKNDNPPVFMPNTLEAKVPEGAAVGTFVAQVTAVDKDSGTNADLSYSLVNNYARFKIDPKSGRIVTDNVLDREQIAQHPLEVIATDAGNPPLRGKANVHVIVADSNDHDPVFENPLIRATVEEKAGPQTIVTVVSASDQDTGINGESDYTITSGNSNAIFTLAKETGVIYVAKQVPSSPNSYTLQIKAANRNNQKRLAMATVQVFVSKVAFPRFLHGDQTLLISELTPQGTTLITVNATGHTSYFIAGGDNGDAFDVDAVFGTLKIKHLLDYEKQKNYTIIIGAKDGSSPAHVGFVKVNIIVQDENDNAPVFSQSVYRATIQEGLPAGFPVITVSAADADSGFNAQIKYCVRLSEGGGVSPFSIYPSSGRLVTKQGLDRENKSSYSLTVRAENVGNSSMSSEAIVLVTVTDVNDNAPVFVGVMSVEVPESATVGTVVAVLRAQDLDSTHDSPLRFELQPDTNKAGVFMIDSSSGNITLAQTLNREDQSTYMLGVTVNDSKHVTRSTLNVTVLDVNDEAPKFAANLYAARLPETSPVGYSIMNVTASDDDIGTNAEIIYSITSVQRTGYFSIDQKLGIISLNKAVQFQKTNAKPSPNVYTLIVRAKNVYSPYLQSDTRVEIEVLDTNDHAPVFQHSSYRFTAVVDSSIGVGVGRVLAEDKFDYGPNAEMRYEVSSGNGSAKFRVVPETGDIRVKSDLSSSTNKVYCVTVKARDRGSPPKESTTQVCVDVTPKNLYAPKFSLSVYQQATPENKAVGSVIVKVTATDDDSGLNGRITYRITSGNDQGYFRIGVTNGSIYVAKPLDYEDSPKYVLNILATDGGKSPKTAIVPAVITLIDVNDNNPVFNPVSYRCKLPENTPARSKVVCKVYATDRDVQGKQDVRYYIAGGKGKSMFDIDEVTGEIKATSVFDLETTSKTSLLIGAKDLGFLPQRHADPRASVTIIITGENEFVPVFSSDTYRGTVAENAPIGHTVLRISATDKDAGADGIVVYHLIGADNHKGFYLNTDTGVLSISGNLDSKKAGNVTLKVIAKNLFQTEVTPDSVGHATITVTVTDANDAPRFLKNVYDANITEGAPKGSYVTNVTAVDDDKDVLVSGPGIRYGISAGNTKGAFNIDTIKGVITTVGELDRESIPVYQLSVTATDNGSPPMTGNATVVVRLRDINDNPPVLVAGDRVASVLENQPKGTSVLTLRAQDLDSASHGGPYAFVISGTDYGKFHLDKNTGLVRTTAKLDREAKASYNLSVRITDNGGLSAVSHCLITVKDQNDNRPKGTARMVKVNTYDRRFPGGSVADIRPEDADVDDTMTCSLLSSSCGFVNFQRGDCMISSRPNTGDSLCLLRINGSDGIGSVRYNVTITFSGYTKDTVKHSLAVRLQKTTPRDFLTTSYHSFSQAVVRILPPEYSSLQIISIKGFDGGLVDLLLAARKPNTLTYLRPEKLSELLKDKKSQVQSEGKVDIYSMDYTPCLGSSPCKNGAECNSEVQATGNTFVVNTVPTVFVSADFNWRYSCRCKPGFTGSTCEVNINDCNPNPCINGGKCENGGSTFKCTCPAGYTGRICHQDINECSSSPCKHATGCLNTVGSYSCQCIPGYSGKNCDFKVDFCQGSPCMYNSTCVAQPSSFKCICDFGGRGDRCQYSSLGFGVVSYMKFKTLRSSVQDTYNNISLSFATSSPNGLLFYNNDGTTNGEGDFIALEIVQGRIWLSYNLGYTKNAAVVKVDRFVSDGEWHHVTVIRDRVTAKVVVDYSYEHQDSVAGQFTKLELNNSPLYVGGVQDFDRELNDPRKHIRTYDFVGCIRDFYINGDQVLYQDALESSGALNHCPHSAYCSRNPCQHGGKCAHTWFGYYCECADGYSGKNCEKAQSNAVRFSASSSLVLEFKESYRREQKLRERQSNSVRSKRAVISSDESFGIRFRTLQGGLILLARDDSPDYTLIQVSTQAVHYEFKSGNTKKNITHFTSSVTDGLWHNVTLRRQDATVTFTLDNVEKQQAFTVKPHRFLGPNVCKWYLGGAAQLPPGVNVATYKGCMEQLKIDGINVPLNGANGYLVSEPQGGAISEGCGEKNGACASSPCSAKERPACVEDWYGYTCVSNKPCTPNPCSNNGTCAPRPDGTFRCVCHANYSGVVCGLCQGEPCVTKEKRVDDSPYSIGLIAGILFLVVIIVGIIVGVLAVRRHQKLKRESDYDAKHCDDICIPAAGDMQDGSHRASPSHSSDDSGVVIRNPSQKSMPDVRISPNDDNKNIVIHKMGPPEDYQLKLHKSDEKIDHGFSESDVGEFVIKNDYAPRTGSRERLDHVIYPRRPEIQQHSTPVERNQQPRQRPRARDRRPPNSLQRQVLDRRHYGPPKTDFRMRPKYGSRHHKRRSNSVDTTSSDEQHDFSDGAPRSEISNSEMLDYYDLEVASIGVSEASYQYDPSMFKDSGVRRDMPAFSQSEIDRIRQSTRNPPSGSFLDAISTSSDEGPHVGKLSSLMERDDTSSESSDDTFTCSEFELDEHPTARAEELDTHGSMIFSKLANAQTTNSPRQTGSRTVSHSTVNMSDDDLIIANRLAQKPPVNGISEDFDWDDVLNWGLRYHNLRGVYKDIAELKDGEHDNGEQYV